MSLLDPNCNNSILHLLYPVFQMSSIDSCFFNLPDSSPPPSPPLDPQLTLSSEEISEIMDKSQTGTNNNSTITTGVKCVATKDLSQYARSLAWQIKLSLEHEDQLVDLSKVVAFFCHLISRSDYSYRMLHQQSAYSQQ